MSFLVTALLALAALGTVLGAAFYLGLIEAGGGVATASATPRPSFVPQSLPPTPSPVITAAPSPTLTLAPSPGGTYVVKPGESLSIIGQKLGIPWLLIAQANNISGPDYIVQVGQTLIIPALPQPSDASGQYVVKPGDNITKIATQFGVDPTDLADYNNIADWNSIQVGQVLHIPGPGWTPLPEASPTPK